MPDTKRAEVSCGCVQLFNLDDVNEMWLRRHLRSRYSNWGNRMHRDLALAGQGYSDGNIYSGETVIFSDISHRTKQPQTNGQRLLSLIQRYKLGRVAKLRTRNPNTGNTITTCLWLYNGTQLPEVRK